MSRRLYERLTAEDIREVEAAIARDEQLQAYYAGASDSRHRIFLLLSFGVWLSIPAVLEKVELGAEQPPEEIHAMARGPLAAAGGLYEADMVASALASVGVEHRVGRGRASTSAAPPGASCGCSPPPTPRSRWHGCDPNGPAIAWAQRSLPAREPLPQHQRAAARARPTARSTSSTRSRSGRTSRPRSACAGSRRCTALIRPGGHLVCTTHGLTSVDFYVKNTLRTPAQSDEIVGALYCARLVVRAGVRRTRATGA